MQVSGSMQQFVGKTSRYANAFDCKPYTHNRRTATAYNSNVLTIMKNCIRTQKYNIMTSISKLSFLLKKGRHAEALASVANYKTVVSDSVSVSGDKVKVMGQVMHVSKGKKMSMSRSINEKRAKVDVTYYRLVFCR